MTGLGADINRAIGHEQRHQEQHYAGDHRRFEFFQPNRGLSFLIIVANMVQGRRGEVNMGPSAGKK